MLELGHGLTEETLQLEDDITAIGSDIGGSKITKDFFDHIVIAGALEIDIDHLPGITIRFSAGFPEPFRSPEPDQLIAARGRLELHFLIVFEFVFKRFFAIIEGGHRSPVGCYFFIDAVYVRQYQETSAFLPALFLICRIPMSKTPIYEGKAKKLFEGPEPGTLIQHFKDDATAFNNKKKGTIQGKGIINNKISEFIMTRLSEVGIPTHFIRNINMREQLVRACDILPLEIIIRNYAAGSFAERFGAFEGERLGSPLIEYCLKDDRLGDPFIAEDHIFAFGIADPEELDEIRHYCYRINDFLSGLFYGIGIRLIDLKLEFGRVFVEEEGALSQIVLADEISPDTCRLWDVNTNDKMDKDRFRRDLGGVEGAYREVARRLGVLPSADVVRSPKFAEADPVKTPTKKAKPAAKKPAAKRKPKK